MSCLTAVTSGGLSWAEAPPPPPPWPWLLELEEEQFGVTDFILRSVGPLVGGGGGQLREQRNGEGERGREGEREGEG